MTAAAPDLSALREEARALAERIMERKTYNGPFKPDPVPVEVQHLLLRLAAAAPSHFNSQPWRFVLIESRSTIGEIADIAGHSMQTLIERGLFFERYKKYFRLTEAEMQQHRSGMHFDHMPAPLRPFARQVFTGAGLAVLRKVGVPARMGRDQRDVVLSSPLLLAVLLDKEEYRPQALSGFYSLFGMGAAVENIWLMTGPLGMGIQFISVPMELPDQWAKIETLLQVPDDLALMAVYRLGYVPETRVRPSIDWSSRHRKTIPQYVFRETCATPETE